MPELPDVEVFRRTVARSALHRAVTGVQVRDTQVLDGVTGPEFERELTGSKLTTTVRYGKHLYVGRNRGPAVTMHFGMTAYVEPGAVDDPLPKHTRVTLCLDGDRRLAYVDPRRFGRLGLADDLDTDVKRRRLGPDALGVARSELAEILAASRGALVTTLMDQSAIAGIGNIYSDEILFQARLHPRAKAADLTAAETDRLHRQLRRVLERAIEAEARPDRMPRGWLIHAREAGAPCPRCGGAVRRYSAAGRHAFWCPSCQGPE